MDLNKVVNSGTMNQTNTSRRLDIRESSMNHVFIQRETNTIKYAVFWLYMLMIYYQQGKEQKLKTQKN